MIRATSEEEKYLTKFTNGAGSGFSDVSAADGGTGISFRPHELLEAALAACVNITLRMYAERHGVPLEDVATEVHLDRTSGQETVFEYGVELHGDSLTEEQRAKLQEIAKACSVQRTLSRPIRFEQRSSTLSAVAGAAEISW